MEQQEEVPRMGHRFGPEDGSNPHELGEEIGSGAAGRVHVCKRLKTGEQFAVKVINTQRLRMLGDFQGHMVKLEREIQILQQLSHPRIVNLEHVFKTKSLIYLVMELVRGGELFDQIVQNKSLQEVEAKFIFRQLLEGVGYMHEKSVIHRDLKPENILVASSQVDGGCKLHNIKIADFGLSKMISDGTSVARTFVGTPQYWAPEVLNVQRSGGTYNQAVDFWSLGAVLFVMLCGRYPFDGKRMPLEEQIRTAAYTMTHPAWQKVSENAKDVIRRLLQTNPSERMDLQGCLKHPWLSDGSPKSLPSPQFVVTEVSGSQAATPASVPVAAQPTTSVLSDVNSISRSEGSVEIAPRAVSQDKSVEVRFTQPPPQTQAVQAWTAKEESKPEHTAEQETIFRLNELLNLQVSIAGALEMACLAFRHTDIELSDEIRNTFQEARNLFQHAAKVVKEYADVAQQVSDTVLSDLKLAVDEKEPSLAVSLLAMVKEWVSNMKEQGEQIQSEYKQLHTSVQHLVQRAQRTKMGADHRLAQTMQAEVDMSPRAMQGEPLLALAGGGGYPAAGPAISAVPSAAGTPTPEGASSTQECWPRPASPPTASSPADAALGPGEGTLAVPAKMPVNPWTRHLFEQLTQSLSSPTGPEQGTSAGSRDKADGEHERGEAWKRDVLELLFMAPGAMPGSTPKAFGPGGSTPKATQPGSSSSAGFRMEADAGREPSASSSATAGKVGHEAICRYVPMEIDTVGNDAAAAHSSASLLRALRELKQVDEILHGCAAFWADMDSTVQKLAQMKEHTERLVGFASNSKALKERFEQRLDEYTNFWGHVKQICEHYYFENQAASKAMYQKVHQVADASDVFDTMQASRGIVRY